MQLLIRIPSKDSLKIVPEFCFQTTVKFKTRILKLTDSQLIFMRLLNKALNNIFLNFG